MKLIRICLNYFLFFFFIGSIMSACNYHRDIPSKGDQIIQVFSNEHIRFDPSINKEGIFSDSSQVLHFADGRIIMKKITLPIYKRHVDVLANITLKSAGDRWDKSGSCFIIPSGSDVNLLTIATGEKSFPESGEELEGFAGIVSTKEYKSSIELMRFMTPFGVGFYNDEMELRRPSYIPVWEDDVNWEVDVTDFLSELEQEVWIGIWIDTWTPEGYQVSFEFKYDETEGPCYAKTETAMLPLVNTVYYINSQKHPDIFARKDIVVEAKIPENAKNIRLKYITTGHGGHSGGDEFVKKENIIYVDGQKVFSFIPWRDDCASFRRFNPSSGTWFEEERDREYIDWKEEKYKTKKLNERISSSDFSRSNWCPGSCVIPEEIALPNLNTGLHKFTFSIPEAQPSADNEMNHWLISAYLVWDVD